MGTEREVYRSAISGQMGRKFVSTYARLDVSVRISCRRCGFRVVQVEIQDSACGVRPFVPVFCQSLWGMEWLVGWGWVCVWVLGGWVVVVVDVDVVV